MDNTSIEALNLFDKRFAVKPDHPLDPRDRTVRFFYNFDEKLIIVGLLETSYVFWWSVTEIDDTEKNRRIFRYIMEARPTAVCDFYRMTLIVDRSAGVPIGCYSGMLESVEYHRNSLTNTRWLTPFGGRYGPMTPDSTGSVFARDVLQHYRALKQRCKFREAGGAYLPILRSYLDTLSRRSGDPCQNYEEKKPLIDLIDSENYLLYSDDPAVRELYQKLVGLTVVLYNQYMAIVR